jgi:hypothetical protein
LDGISQRCGRSIDRDALLAAWLPKLAARLATGWRDGPLGDWQRQQASAWVEKRYAAGSWTINRGQSPASVKACGS